MMNRRRQSLVRKQHGFVLIALVALLVMGGLYFFISNLSPEVIEARRQEKTEAALVQAREALIGYALQYREQQKATGDPDAMYGHLPLPDFGESVNLNGNLANQPCTSEGCAKINPSGVSGSTVIVGRFPWKTLGTEPLRDGHAECLWYAISATHRAVSSTATTMNWDTLAVPDVVIGSGLATLAAVNAHDRPIAVIFSAGAAFDNGRTTSADASECGGNYDVAHYVNAALNNAQRSLPVTSAMLFDTLRKSTVRAPLDPPSRLPSFRDDINDMIEGMVPCARDQIFAGSIAANAKVNNACSSALDALGLGPRGYYTHYRDQVFVAKCSACQVTVDTVLAPSCAGTLIFGNQRSSGQNRRDVTEMGDPSNYLEGDNLASFNSTGNLYTGFSKLLRVSTVPPIQTPGQDIVRCIPSGASMVRAPSALPAGSELSQYDAASRTITLGRVNIESDRGYGASSLFGCIWEPEAHATGSGFRKYFLFQITDAGDGLAFAAVDGDRNSTSVCGAAEQHLGYSGNNGFTTPIAYPKLGLEIDTRRNFRSKPPYVPDGFDPTRIIDATTLRTLANGRADPNYAGGHIGLVYWGGESPISTGYACSTVAPIVSCRSPSFCDTDNICKLNQEEDDNVHGQLPTAPASRPPPLNPVAPVTPPTNPPYPPYAVDKLDPSLSSVPLTAIHMRMEVTRVYTGRDDNSRLVRAVSANNLAALSGLPSVDGVTLAAGDTLLVAGQTDASANGVYVAAAGTWTRATSADEAFELAPGTSWFIKEGSTYKGSLWRLQNQEVPILGFNVLDIQRFRSPVKTVATTNITLSGLSAVGGYTPLAGDRILLAGQTDPKENGVWIAAVGAWSRSSPENASSGMKDGAMWFVAGGANINTYWRLNGDSTPGTSNISIAQAVTNDLYVARVTTEAWKEGSNVDQIARMKDTTRSMHQLDPVVRHGTCAPSAPLCPISNPVDQYCGGTETDGLRYCYTGQQPKLYDSQKIFDIRSATSCGSNASCSGTNQFCGIDNVCYQPALRTTRLGFTISQSTQSQVISVDNHFPPTWLP
jgi:type II secretory pathway pseudopilin PulG